MKESVLLLWTLSDGKKLIRKKECVNYVSYKHGAMGDSGSYQPNILFVFFLINRKDHVLLH